jgi:glycosyltransferase involved in cell wall biosynthesis
MGEAYMGQPQQHSTESPSVSVVIPTCNRREVLARCLAALTRQSHTDFEVIVVDDCSDDGTPEFLAEYAEAHPEFTLRWLVNETHAGANPSRNRGIRTARAELVAFLDSDCIAEPQWLEQLVAGFSSERVAAVTGRVNNLPPSNIYELAFKGTHRLAGAGPAHRLVAGNMCVRRDLLLRFMLDEDRAEQPMTADGRPDLTVSGRGDEEGLFLHLRAAGYEQRVVPDAAVLHEHRIARRSFFRQAFRGGRSAARLVYKYYLPPRIDMLPFILAYLTLLLLFIDLRLWPAPALLLLLALAAITYNDLFRKGKTVGQTLRSFPILLAYYHVRLVGYVLESFRLRLSRHDIQRVRLRATR